MQSIMLKFQSSACIVMLNILSCVGYHWQLRENSSFSIVHHGRITSYERVLIMHDEYYYGKYIFRSIYRCAHTGSSTIQRTTSVTDHVAHAYRPCTRPSRHWPRALNCAAWRHRRATCTDDACGRCDRRVNTAQSPDDRRTAKPEAITRHDVIARLRTELVTNLHVHCILQTQSCAATQISYPKRNF